MVIKKELLLDVEIKKIYDDMSDVIIGWENGFHVEFYYQKRQCL